MTPMSSNNASGSVVPPPSSTPALSMDTLRERIRTAFNKLDTSAIEKQKRTVEFGKYNAILVPIAVLLLTVQILAFSEYSFRPIAILLISIELLILFTTLFILFTDIPPRSHEWANDRMRAEVLRREEFLLITQVGPYLTQSRIQELNNAVNIRLAQINTPTVNPAGLIRLQTNGVHWRDVLEDTPIEKSALPDIVSIGEYVTNRAQDQQGWYFKKSQLFAKKDIIYERVTKGVLIGALVMSAMHLISLIFLPPEGRLPLHLIIEILAITLPPIGAALAALQTFFQYRRLSHSYEYHSRALSDLTPALQQLLIRMENKEFQPDEKNRLNLEFKRRVLQTEEVLASELRQWYFCMRPETP